MSFFALFKSAIRPTPITTNLKRSFGHKFRRNVLVSSTSVRSCSQTSPSLQPPYVSGTESEKAYPPNIVQLVDDIAHLSLLEVAELTELLQKRLNITTPTAMMMPAMASASTASGDADAEADGVADAPVKSSFNVKLLNFTPDKKVALIKEIKLLLPEMNLVQAKKFVEAVPGNVKMDVSKDEAEEIKKVLESVGATIEIE